MCVCVCIIIIMFSDTVENVPTSDLFPELPIVNTHTLQAHSAGMYFSGSDVTGIVCRAIY